MSSIREQAVEIAKAFHWQRRQYRDAADVVRGPERMETMAEKLAEWQVEANRWRFIRKRAEGMARFAAQTPCLSFEKYLEIAESELTKSVKWLELPAYYDMPYGSDGVCPVDWGEFYKMEQDIQQKLIGMGQWEYEKWVKGSEPEDNATKQARARRNAEINWSLQRSKDAIARHAGRTTAQQKEHERSGNYPW